MEDFVLTRYHSDWKFSGILNVSSVLRGDTLKLRDQFGNFYELKRVDKFVTVPEPLAPEQDDDVPRS